MSRRESRRLLEEALFDHVGGHADLVGSRAATSHLERGRRPNPALLVPVVSICFRHEDTHYDFFSTVTTLGTPQDVTLEELRIECFFPANPATEQQARALLGA